MGIRWTALALVFVLWQASGGEQYAGIWTGTYDGTGTGTSDLKSVMFDGTKMTATYDFPPDMSAEIVMTATFESASAKGTWSLRPKGQPDELASGGIAVTKK